MGRVAAARQSARSESRKARLQRWLAMDKDRATRDARGGDAVAEGESVRGGGGTMRPESAGVSKLRARAMAQEPDEDQTGRGTTSGRTQVEAGMRRDLLKLPVAAGLVHNNARDRRQSGAGGRILVAKGLHRGAGSGHVGEGSKMTERDAAYAGARSLLAALADTAADPETAGGFEEALLQLDHIDPAARRPVQGASITDRAAAYNALAEALTQLGESGVDPFELALCRSMVATAWRQDRTR